MKVKTILVSQPAPTNENSPYFDLEKKLKLNIDFRTFIHVEGCKAKEIRDQKIDFSAYTAIILTSRNAIDHFFRIAEEMRYKVPGDMKYFCQSEAIANYLQKYIVYRKRKIYIGERTFQDLSKQIQKHNTENFLLPSSDKLQASIPAILDELKVKWQNATLYRTVVSDLSDLSDVKYDILVFFSPSGIDSLLKNFPSFEQGKTRIAIFGKTTAKATEAAGLRVDILAPTPESPSMTMALENYVKQANKR